MQDDTTIEKVEGARWAVSRIVRGHSVYLIERTHVSHVEDIERALDGLGIRVNMSSKDRYFPRNSKGDRCPTFVFMKLWFEHGAKDRVTGSSGV